MRSEGPPKPWWLVASALVALAASPPEVVQVRVPSAKVSRWFPPGSDLRVLPYDRFEALMRAARERPPAPQVARILKARHRARWDAGHLGGRTELTVEAPPGGAADLLILEPWSPAVVGREGGAKFLRATPDGRLALRVEGDGHSKVEFEWELRPRPGSEGRAFALDLPGVDVSSLTLDLPVSLTPEATAGVRTGPEPGGGPDRAAWRFEALRGKVGLRLRDRPGEDGRPDSPCLWLEGTTRIDLSASPVNWRAEWTLDEAPGAARELTIGFDPGLEVVDVTGPRVASFRVESSGLGSKAAIRLDGEGAGPSPLTIRAICHPPAEGTWPVPSARPLDATWTGGRTLVRLDAGRAFQSCRERSGRRVPPRPGDPAGASGLIFEPTDGVGPVAELTFRRPTADATVQVRGLLRLGDDVPRIEVALTWSSEKGRPMTLAADLPPGWTPDGVVSATGQPAPWHADPLGNGGTRVQLGPSSAGDGPREVTLHLTASARQAGVTGPLDLPRVRPASAGRVVDEVWVATPDPGLAIRPILASGLAWLDPPDPFFDNIPTPWGVADLAGALAWRWLAEGAEARIDREPPGESRRGEVGLEATIRRDRLTLEWSVEVDSPRGDSEPIPVHFEEVVGGPIAWRSREAGGPIIEARPMSDARRDSLGLPPIGVAWDLSPPGPSPGRLQILGRVEVPWPGRGRLPILTMPGRYRAKGTVGVTVEKDVRTNVESAGLTAIEPAVGPGGTASPPTDDAAPRLDPRSRKAARFAYGPAGGRLVVETTAPRFGPVGGLVREAVLVSQVSPGAGMRHRLTLGVAVDSARSLAFTMPRGVAIDRLRRDGLDVDPIPSGDNLLVELPAPIAARPLCSLAIEYRTEDDPRVGPIEPSRLLPRCSLPCLCFAWELIAPEPWVLSAASGGLEATDPKPASSATSTLLGFHWSPWGDRDQGRRAEAGEAMLRDSDRVAAGIADGEANLGEWILKLDAGRWPLALDRLAIRACGWGPGSRIAPGTGEPNSSGPIRSVLEPMGLVAIPLDGLILITSKSIGPDVTSHRDAWSAALRAVPFENSAASDRFQSAARWRDEATPRATGSGDSAASPGRGRRWHSWHVASTGWPLPGGSVSMVDDRADLARGWLVAALVLAAGVLARGKPARARAVGLAAVGVVASIGLAWHWPASSSTFSGLLRGGLGVLAVWLGRSSRRIPPPTTPEVSTTSRRGGLLGGPILTPVLAVVMGFGVASVGADAEAPILALLPFDGPADPGSKPDRAVMLVKDHDRLERLAEGDAPPVARASLASASHQVGRDEPGLAVVESHCELDVSGPGPAPWSMPIGPAIELAAEVDGRPSPLAITPDGLSASVSLEGAGAHRLRFRRKVPLSAVGRGGEGARLPINRAAFARVAVAKGAGASWVEVVGTKGKLASGPGGIEGGLGPVDTLEVRWFPEDRPPEAEIKGPVDATFLWDARPAGDLIRMRLEHSDPEGVPAIRLAMGAGLKVRRHTIPGLVSIRREGTAAKPEWTAHVDPPWPPGVPIEVEFWRAAPTDSDLRRWPGIDLPAAGKLSGWIGFRRPSDWSGRLEPGGGIEPASEATFAKTWGNLPDDGLTLAGAVRHGRSIGLEVATRPLPPRRSIRTRVALELAAGRLEASIAGVLADRQARSFDLGVSLPGDLRVVRVEADGLVDWQKVSRDRLRLQFDGSEAPERRIRIDAYLPVSPDSVMSEARNFEAKAPWPLWEAAEPTQGTLEVAGPTRFQFDPGAGVVPLPVAGPASNAAEALFRASYRVDSPSGPSTVRWSSPPAKVTVGVESELAIDPSSLSWTATLTCDVSGGPAEALNLSLPAEWAEGATLEIEGLTHRLVAQPGGTKGEATLWKILPDRPIWGRARLIVRSKRPYRPGREFAYPQVAPLAATGRGAVGRYDVAIGNGSGRTMEVAGSSGLRPVDASRFRASDSPSSSSREIDRAFHVTGERWSLRLKVGRPGEGAASAPEARETRVGFARLECRAEVDGSITGRASYELDPRPGPFLAIRLPAGAEITWASVDGVIGPALVDAPGRRLIPLGDGAPHRVVFAWHSPPASRPDGRAVSLGFPSPERSTPPTLIAAEAPRSLTLTASEGGLERIGRPAWDLDDFEQIARTVVDSLGNLDRTSRVDREAILGDLVEVELRVRRASRLAIGKDRPVDPTAGRLQAALNAIAEAAQVAGLDDLIQEARARVGVAPPLDDSVEGAAYWPAEVVRLRGTGLSHYFRAPAGDLGRPPTMTRAARSEDRRSGTAGTWAVAGIGSLSWLGIAGLIGLRFRPSGRLAKGLIVMTILAVLAWEPAGVLATLGLYGWGRLPD